MLIYLFVFAFRFKLLKSAAVLVRFSSMKSWKRLALDVSETFAKHDVSETLAKRGVPETFANARHAGLLMASQTQTAGHKMAALTAVLSRSYNVNFI